MKRLLLLLCIFISIPSIIYAQEQKLTQFSEQTQECLSCHSTYTPGIVEDWLKSRHAVTTPESALKSAPINKRMSATNIPANLLKNSVGCYECHSLNADIHKDNFEHNGYKINVIVTPNDCSTCHPEELKQFSGSKKANAHDNLLKNPVYHTLVDSITGVKRLEQGKLITDKPTDQTLNDVCLGCHGTKVEVLGMKKISTAMGEMEVPNLTNWPNQGVGRINPDGSKGSCASCHTRHRFSIAEARKPYTCAQCHAEPDVPAWLVYKVSKHGNIFQSNQEKWNFDNVPWVLGKDFTAPTCATCHNSLIVSPDGEVIAQRSHDFGARLWVRIFGLIYSHPQPKSGDTTVIKNSNGQTLPTSFDGKPASEFLISKDEQLKRKDIMTGVCKACHSSNWVEGHFKRFDSTVAEADKMVKAATDLVSEAWKRKLADPSNPFDEGIEHMWINQWLFFANTVRYASAMTGAYDYTGFNLGWWEMSRNLVEMHEKIYKK